MYCIVASVQCTIYQYQNSCAAKIWIRKVGSVSHKYDFRSRNPQIENIFEYGNPTKQIMLRSMWCGRNGFGYNTLISLVQRKYAIDGSRTHTTFFHLRFFLVHFIRTFEKFGEWSNTIYMVGWCAMRVRLYSSLDSVVETFQIWFSRAKSIWRNFSGHQFFFSPSICSPLFFHGWTALRKIWNEMNDFSSATYAPLFGGTVGVILFWIFSHPHRSCHARSLLSGHQSFNNLIPNKYAKLHISFCVLHLVCVTLINIKTMGPLRTGMNESVWYPK